MDTGLYIHLPFCHRKCLYCDFLSFKPDERTVLSYTEILIKEIKGLSGLIKTRRVPSVYIGGGTPSYVHESVIRKIMKTVYENYNITDDAEITIEVNPASADIDKLKAYRRAGINRLSIGLQSADDKELKLLGRLHDYSGFVKTYEDARLAGFKNISVDLMTAIPSQTMESLKSTIDKITDLKPEHISAYSLMICEGTPFEKMYGNEGRPSEKIHESKGTIPDEDTERKMYYLVRDELAKAGYKRYEISNFAKPGYESRHNISYWERKEYLGFGLGAASYLNGERYSNIKDIKEYLDYWAGGEGVGLFLDNYRDGITGSVSDNNRNIVTGELPIPYKDEFMVLTKENRMEEAIFLGLRMDKGLKLSEFKEEFDCDLMDIFRKPAMKYLETGHLKIEDGVLKLTDAGVDVSNVIFADFLL